MPGVFTENCIIEETVGVCREDRDAGKAFQAEGRAHAAAEWRDPIRIAKSVTELEAACIGALEPLVKCSGLCKLVVRPSHH